MGGTKLKFESWKVRIHNQNASQKHFCCFLKNIWILKAGCHLKSPNHANVKVFEKPRHLTNRKHVNYLPWTHTRVTQFILRMIFLMYMINSQKVTFPTPHTECVCTDRMSVHGKIGGFFSSEREFNIKKFTPKVSCLYLLWFVCEWLKVKVEKIVLQEEKKVTQNGYFCFHVISWRMHCSIHLIFLHVTEQKFLCQMRKLWITASILYIFNLISKTVILHVTYTVISSSSWYNQVRQVKGRN